ncbi:MAG: glycosyltransferase family 9 protein [bacterium]
MRVSTIRKIDRWVGLPACLMLTVIRKLGLGGFDRPTGAVRKIVFIKLAEQGSTVLAHAAISRAIEMVGREHVYFLVFKENRFVCDVMELIPPDNVVTVNAESLPSAFISSIGAVLRLRKLGVDAAVDLEFYARSSALFTFLSGATRRVGFHSWGGEGHNRGDLMTHRLIYNPHYHTGQIFHMMVEALAHPAGRFPAFDFIPPSSSLDFPVFHPEAGEVEVVQGILRELAGISPPHPLVLLNANCSDLLPLRKWDSANYLELARRLIKQFPTAVVAFTGAPDEAAGAGALCRAVNSPRCVCMAGRTTLRQLLTLYSLADVLVTNDSGPAHFASLTTTDVITLFGPETPALFAARTGRNHVIWAGVACSPCVNAYNDRLSFCHDNVCMQNISVERVYETVVAVLNKRLLRDDFTRGTA